MKVNRWFGVGWASAAVVLLLGVAFWGCGSESDLTSPESSFNPPPAGSGAGLLAVEIESFGTLDDGLEGVFAVAESDSGKGQGHKERTPLTALFVTFDAIRVYPACEDSAGVDDDSTDVGEDDGGEDSTSAAAWYGLLDEEDGGDQDRKRELDGECEYLEFLIEPPVTVNVADLDSTLTTVLGTLEIPMGDYNHLSLRLADAWVVTAEGDEVPAELPGGDQNWLKIIVPFTVEDGQVTEIVIAFDLSRSIVETPPGSGNFKIKPVLHGHVGRGGEGHQGSGGGGQGQGGGSGQGQGGGGK